MIRLGALILICVAAAAEAAEAPTAVTFGYVDLYVDSGASPLAAYQIDFAASRNSARIVGIEGGEHPAFKSAPYSDPSAKGGERVVIAAFSTAKDLPVGKTRVARIHLELTSGVAPAFDAKLIVAATAGGAKINATLTLTVTGGNP